VHFTAGLERDRKLWETNTHNAVTQQLRVRETSLEHKGMDGLVSFHLSCRYSSCASAEASNSAGCDCAAYGDKVQYIRQFDPCPNRWEQKIPSSDESVKASKNCQHLRISTFKCKEQCLSAPRAEASA
jgi:hypothetical protein